MEKWITNNIVGQFKNIPTLLALNGNPPNMIPVTPIELSIIIPTLNEQENLKVLLHQLQNQLGLSFEVIVSDGGSGDGTELVAREFQAGWVKSKRGRGPQLRAGSRAAQGEYFLFLHADSQIQGDHFLANALGALKEKQKVLGPNVAGHFSLKFVRTQAGRDFAYRFTEGKTQLNRWLTTNGDQGMLLGREFYHSVGGFNPELLFMEDQEFAERLRKEGTWMTLPGTIHTSARRFEVEGHGRRLILMSLLMGVYYAGMTEYLGRVPEIYVEQSKATRLRVAPFIKALWHSFIFDYGPKGSLQKLYLVGKFTRKNSWQLCYLLDVRFGNKESDYRWLAFHDKHIDRLIDNKFCNALAGLGTFICYAVIFYAYFSWTESGPLAKSAKTKRSIG